MRILLIQTAFLGDVVLITPMIREIKIRFPEALVDVLVRKGNESILSNNPHINEVLIWDKKRKYASLFENLSLIRSKKYKELICIQRYFNAGLLAVFSKAERKVGFKQNPWSRFFDLRITHRLEGSKHEVERNLELIAHLIEAPQSVRPELYPSKEDEKLVSQYQNGPYYCLAPASVWFTKQLPKEKWIEIVQLLPKNATLYFLGGPGDFGLAQDIMISANSENTVNLCGKLTLMQSAALMRSAQRNYVNDSGPLHLASATDSNVTAFFCSTIPQFGFGPLSEDSQVIEVSEPLSCRPCGTHGFKSCPKGHLACGNQIDVSKIHY